MADFTATSQINELIAEGEASGAELEAAGSMTLAIPKPFAGLGQLTVEIFADGLTADGAGATLTLAASALKVGLDDAAPGPIQSAALNVFPQLDSASSGAFLIATSSDTNPFDANSVAVIGSYAKQTLGDEVKEVGVTLTAGGSQAFTAGTVRIRGTWAPL